MHDPILQILFFIQQFENGLKEVVLVKVDVCDEDINSGSIKKLLESSKITERLLRNRHNFILNILYFWK